MTVLPNQRLELPGRPGRGSMDRWMDREASMEPMICDSVSLSPQLKRGR